MTREKSSESGLNGGKILLELIDLIEFIRTASWEFKNCESQSLPWNKRVRTKF